MLNLDKWVAAVDRGLKTVWGPNGSVRGQPGANIVEEIVDPLACKHAAALMRVNYSGEVCAQALYQGQALTAKNPALKKLLEQSAHDETEHLAWCSTRLRELGGRKSLLDPFWYAGSLVIGALGGALGDKWNLGFLAETERQVELHLAGHLARLPEGDVKSRAIIEQMKTDEARHAATAIEQGGAELPAPVRHLMRLTSQVMTKIAFWI